MSFQVPAASDTRWERTTSHKQDQSAQTHVHQLSQGDITALIKLSAVNPSDGALNKPPKLVRTSID